jgi:uncharacterized lipoprotein NlpE involved in copper resistance
MMRKKYYVTAVLIVLITVGCNNYGALKKDYGNSYDAAKYGQTLNPGASKNLQPATGLPGKAAESTMKKYTDSFASSGQASQTPQSFAITPIVPTEGAGTGQNVYGK